MRKILCDRCGVEIRGEENVHEVTVGHPNDVYDAHNYDKELCPSCAGDLKGWLDEAPPRAM